MTRGFFITGTDTNVGKTVVAAWAALHLRAEYWKPVQAGADPETDSDTVRRLSGATTHPETYVLPDPLSPHEAARRAGIRIALEDFVLPSTQAPLIVEGAGGLLVPLNEEAFVIDLAAGLALPVLLVARSTLGTINHTLLSLEALRRRNLEIAGVVINGPPSAHNRAAIEAYGQVRTIAELPPLAALGRDALLGIAPELDLSSLLRPV
jgi:dethiobiotin synthetase